ncbi:MAG: protein-L-isoaspartate O-methyltransferase family protein [Pikeienuella sp.]
MSDLSTARTAMVDRQVRPSDVTSFPIIESMLWTPRERFTPVAQRAVAYADLPVSLGNGREMLDPRTFAKLLDGARIGPDDLVLDIAPGYGYSTAVIARMAAAVIAVEPDEAMAAAASGALAALEVDNALVSHGDAAAGDPEHGPFDAIFVNVGVSSPPEALLAQLKDGGRMVAIEMAGGSGRAVVYVKTGERIATRRLFDAATPVAPWFEAEATFAF